MRMRKHLLHRTAHIIAEANMICCSLNCFYRQKGRKISEKSGSSIACTSVKTVCLIGSQCPKYMHVYKAETFDMLEEDTLLE